MSLEKRIAIGRYALTHTVPSHSMVIVYSVLWAIFTLKVCTSFPSLALAWIPIHLLCAWQVYPRGQSWVLAYILFAPGLAMYLLPVALRIKSFRNAETRSVVIPPHKEQVVLPRVRVCAANTTLDLDSGEIVGSMHARMQDLAQRTPVRAGYIQILHTGNPGAILVSGVRHHVLVGRDGKVLGIARIHEASP